MSGLSVKSPLCKAIVTDFFYTASFLYAISGFSVNLSLHKAIVIDFFIQYQRKFLITYKKIVYVNLEYQGILKPWKTCDLTTMKHQLKTV